MYQAFSSPFYQKKDQKVILNSLALTLTVHFTFYFHQAIHNFIKPLPIKNFNLVALKFT
jgi:hypothetical protein